MMIHLFHLEVEQNKFQGKVDMWLIVSSGRTYCQQLSCDFRCQATPTGGMCFCNTGYQIDPRDNRTCIGTYIPLSKVVGIKLHGRIVWQTSGAPNWQKLKLLIVSSIWRYIYQHFNYCICNILFFVHMICNNSMNKVSNNWWYPQLWFIAHINPNVEEQSFVLWFNALLN